MIHVFIGTKAQYIKMAPLLRRMDDERVDYRLIDSGQHAALAERYRTEFGLRDPDLQMGGDGDVESIPEALRWALGLSVRLASRTKLRDEVLGGHDGVCVVHGDTPTTLLSVLMAKRAGLAVAHVESGLRSRRVFHPFPEELTRMFLPRLMDVMFAPGPEAVSNLREMGVKGKIVEQSANTVLESVRDSVEEVLEDEDDPDRNGSPGSAIVTMHLVENIHRRDRREALVDVVEAMAATVPVRWVMHGHTERVLSGDARPRLEAAGVELVPLKPRGEFLEMVASAPFVITDGGSIQEECAMLGVPTLLWRDCSERPDGLGENIVLSRYDREVVDDFLSDPQQYRRPRQLPEVSPTAQILTELAEWR